MEVEGEGAIVALEAAQTVTKIRIVSQYSVKVCGRCAQPTDEFRHRNSRPRTGIDVRRPPTTRAGFCAVDAVAQGSIER